MRISAAYLGVSSYLDDPVIAESPLVSVVMPVLNEERHLERALAALAGYPGGLLEIIIVDGGSSDRSPALARFLASTDPRIRFLSRPGLNCPASMNVGICASRGRFICKLDGHGFASERFFSVGLSYLRRNPEVGCVGGKIVPISQGAVQRSNALARFSLLGVGRGVYSAQESIQSIDTVQCGLYRREALRDAGLFDPGLQFGEDEELNYRVRLAGWGIVYHPGMRFHHHGRDTFGGLFRQYYRYGSARARVVAKHRAFLKPKHLAPVAATASLGMGALSPFLDPISKTAAITGCSLYLSFIFCSAIFLAVKRRFTYAHLLALSLLCLHVGYGSGLIAGLISGIRPKRGSPTCAEVDLTRAVVQVTDRPATSIIER